MTLRELHLFAGAGGGLLGSLLLGHRPVCAVEIDPYCRRVLAARRDEGWLPAEMEIYDDVTTFDGHAWRGRVDLVAGGFPCQDISVAGKGAGLEGARSGLFYKLLRVVRMVRPKWVYLENVPAITSRGLDRVLGALAELGFDAEWCVLSAADAGAPHLRKRWWCLARQSADADGRRCASDEQPSSGGSPTGRGEADAARQQGDGRGRGKLAGEAGAWRCGDAAALAGGADDPDADSGRQQVGGSSELHRGGDASWRDADGLRQADAPDAAHDGCVLGPRGDADQRQVVQAEQGTKAGDAYRRSQPCGRCGGDGDDAPDAASEGLEARDGQRAPKKSGPECCGQAGADVGPAERRLGGAPDGLAEWVDSSARGYWAGDWETQPRLAQGQTDRVARLRALGNGQVPQTAAIAFRILMQRFEDNP